ncbi:sarcosine oxidase subunit gamma [Rhizobium mesoamericanum]|uniref:sarcosine oxidase subunit gamma n=1 Tax=Rhizobium mesoamericanum TaxID=1079800 RepID=UPI00278B261E|nr:sarcosine oxidase subunit gamma family protein [Rhizobium mesoamericanum]MDQ0561240.1 sarcosine oxidase subunit gamma [Rhizobium mesoamericanum]
MPDLPEHRPALAGKAIFEGPGIRLEPLPEGHLLHIMGALDAESLAGYLSAAGLPASAVRPAGYQQWYIAGDEDLSPPHIAALAEHLKGKAFVSDQSHGRIRIGLSGAKVADLLSRGTAVDLDPAIFPVGHSAVTLFGHVSVQLTHTQTDRFELTVLRSYAVDLYEALEHLAGTAMPINERRG